MDSGKTSSLIHRDIESGSFGGLSADTTAKDAQSQDFCKKAWMDKWTNQETLHKTSREINIETPRRYVTNKTTAMKSTAPGGPK